jgi:hypothetical protein
MTDVAETREAPDANAALVDRMREVYRTGDMEQIERAALDYYTDGTVDEFPQSGEVFRGRALAEAMSAAYNEATGTQPSFTFREARGRDDFWVIEGTIDYGDRESALMVTIVELRDGTVARQTDYFASPFEAPEWRRPFREAQ